jgi:hypothetical protein
MEMLKELSLELTLIVVMYSAPEVTVWLVALISVSVDLKRVVTVNVPEMSRGLPWIETVTGFPLPP